MEALRTWTCDGDKPLTIAIYKPVMTVRFGDGPEAELTPAQVAELSTRLIDAENYFESEDPEDF